MDTAGAQRSESDHHHDQLNLQDYVAEVYAGQMEGHGKL
jgi:hypothetical protein